MQGGGLSEYLVARRSLMRPEDFGLTRMGRRRVPGLRREELALLAGISVDYYTRLEQGRQQPSARVLDALAEALGLDDDGTRYLHQLGRPTRRPEVARPHESVSTGLAQVLLASSENPVLMLGRLREVLLINPLCAALLPVLRVGLNQLRVMFLDPAARELYRDWHGNAVTSVAALRGISHPDVEDLERDDLIRELSEKSCEFREIWARHDAGMQPLPTAKFHNPFVGDIDLHHELLTIIGAEDQLLIIYYAEPGTPSVDTLEELKKYVT